MNFFARLRDRWRRKRSAPIIPAVIRKLAQPLYTENATPEELRVDHAECRALRGFVRQNFSEQEYLRYVRVLDDLQDLIDAKRKLASCHAAEQMALDKLNAAYAARLN